LSHFDHWARSLSALSRDDLRTAAKGREPGGQWRGRLRINRPLVPGGAWRTLRGAEPPASTREG